MTLAGYTGLDIFIQDELILTGGQIKDGNSKAIFSLSIKTYVVGAQKNRLNETVLLSTQNI